MASEAKHSAPLGKLLSRLDILFALAGTLLVLLGVTTGLQVPWLERLVPIENLRWVAVGVGCLFAILAVAVKLLPPKEHSAVSSSSDHEKTDFQTRHKLIGNTQNEILGVIVEKAPHMVNEKDIRERIRARIPALNKASDSHLYYRLEQLWLMKFIRKEGLGNAYLYGLSPEYQAYRASKQ